MKNLFAALGPGSPDHVLWPGTIRASLILIVLIIGGAFYWNRRSPKT